MNGEGLNAFIYHYCCALDEWQACIMNDRSASFIKLHCKEGGREKNSNI